MPRPRGNGQGKAAFRTGRPPRPVKDKPDGRKVEKVIDREAVDALKVQFEAERVAAEEAKAAKRTVPVAHARGLPATGRCHDCDKAVSGERRFCGRCLAKR